MGTWGTDLYADDTACDVRDDCVAALQAGLTGRAVADRVLARYRPLLDTPQVACCVYFALADTAWRHGQLSEEVKAQALAWLDAGGDLSIGERDAPLHRPARLAALEQLAARLRSPQPAVQAVAAGSVVVKRVHTAASVGSAFVLGLPSGGRAALVIVGFKDLGSSLDPVFSVPVWRGSGTDLPPLDHLATMGTLTMPSFQKPRAHVAVIPPDGPKGYMSQLQPVGVVTTPWPFDPSDVIWLSLGRIAKAIDQQLAVTP